MLPALVGESALGSQATGGQRGVRLGWQGSPSARGPTEGHDNYDSRQEELDSVYLNPEDNEAHAPGQVCARCGAVITAGQDVRLQADNRWVHEVCP